jgi:hypothetical protein
LSMRRASGGRCKPSACPADHSDSTGWENLLAAGAGARKLSLT